MAPGERLPQLPCLPCFPSTEPCCGCRLGTSSRACRTSSPAGSFCSRRATATGCPASPPASRSAPPAFTAGRASRRSAGCGSGRAPSSAAEANPRLPTNEPCIGCRLESARLAPGEGEGGGVFHPSATVRDCIGDLPMVLDAQVLTIDCHDEALRQAKFKLDLLPRIQLLGCNFQQRTPLLHSRWLDRPWQRICLP